MKVALALALLLVLACAVAPRAAADHSAFPLLRRISKQVWKKDVKQIPESCNAVEKTYSYKGAEMLKSVTSLSKAAHGSFMAACCALCAKTPDCRHWEYSGDGLGYRCSLFAEGAARKAFVGCRKCSQLTGSV